MSLEGLEGSVAAETTHVDAHVSAAGGEGGVVLPVHVQGWSCGTPRWLTTPTSTTIEENTVHEPIWFYLSERETAAWLLLYVRPK